MTPDAVIARPRLLSRDARQAQLLRAAAAAFARAGYAATSMDDVATEAGVTKLIVYRHFASKEDLYRAVLSGVAERLHEEFVEAAVAPEAERRGFPTRALLAVARENPEGFRLLMVHAAREPQFVELAASFEQRGLAVADLLIADMIPDPTIKAWATKVIVDYLVRGVLTWCEVGDPSRDAEFIELATNGLVGMFTAWADLDRIPELMRPVQP